MKILEEKLNEYYELINEAEKRDIFFSLLLASGDVQQKLFNIYNMFKNIWDMLDSNNYFIIYENLEEAGLDNCGYGDPIFYYTLKNMINKISEKLEKKELNEETKDIIDLYIELEKF
jgi:hypothetical protein